MGNGGQRDTRSNLQKDFEHCMVKHTLNLDGSRGAYGDLAVVGCVVDRQIDRVASSYSDRNTYSDRNAYRNAYGNGSGGTMGPDTDRNGNTPINRRGDKR